MWYRLYVSCRCPVFKNTSSSVICKFDIHVCIFKPVEEKKAILLFTFSCFTVYGAAVCMKFYYFDMSGVILFLL